MAKLEFINKYSFINLIYKNYLYLYISAFIVIFTSNTLNVDELITLVKYSINALKFRGIFKDALYIVASYAKTLDKQLSIISA